MTKLQQLEWIRRLGLPTPNFRGVGYEAFRRGDLMEQSLAFPLAVRSTYSEEDGGERSFAGHFRTELGVEREGVTEAVAAVFDSYPSPEGQSVILQEMIEPDFAGVLFAYRRAAWKVEWVTGRGEALVSGRGRPESLLLPRFDRTDRWTNPWAAGKNVNAGLRAALIHLSVCAGRLLSEGEAAHGLDIEFAVRKGGLFLLQARPVTTPEAAEEVLSSANHKEILPPEPSRLMTSVIAGAGEELFAYYRSLDPGLPPRSFIETAAGMPWINLSALLDTMVRWGLPTRLVCDSVGAEDPYRVGLRPLVAVRRIPVFLNVLKDQWTARRSVGRWVEAWKAELPGQQGARNWEADSATAFADWLADFQRLYVELVTHMQALTGAMSGPVALLSRLGWLEKIAPHLRQHSASTDYLRAFQDLQSGKTSREEFLEAFGHRGFYESDIGQRRFWEYSEEEWEQLGKVKGHPPSPSGLRRAKKVRSQKLGDQESHGPKVSQSPSLKVILSRPVIQLIHTREWIRHESMRFFWAFREEMKKAAEVRFGKEFEWWTYRTEDLALLFSGERSPEDIDRESYEVRSGWDLDTFIADRYGRRAPLSVLTNVSGIDAERKPLGIYPGRVRGQVWRVRVADFSKLEQPDFPVTILVAEALDPGWVPFFSRVDGVATYVGGLLSHASIVLREAGIPSVTQLPASLELETGDWVELDGKTGKVEVMGDG